jgi:ribosomal protein S18 acetylase RimI-like enzyme
MAGLKLLLDTNIVIALEDPRTVPPGVALLAQKAQLHGLTLYLDDACVADIERDPNLERREATLSKLHKFPTLPNVAHRSDAELTARFGDVRTPNDRCDVLMLDTLDRNVVDFLVSEDIGLHKRAERAALRDRVFTVREALGWILRTFEPREFRLPYVASRKAYQIPTSDPIFDSLREGYPDFDDWWLQKCVRQHRDCWVVEIDGQLAGLVVYKTETHAEAHTRHPGPRILKVCTFKMKPEYRGEKFGEQLLKKVLWYAQGNGYDLVYLTAYADQEFLITLLQTFGFEITRTQSNGELMIEKALVPNEQPVLLESSAIESDMRAYPRFYEGEDVGKYVIPIQPAFHRVLFPEISESVSLSLFPEMEFGVDSNTNGDRTPGNTIRKVYVCRSPTRTLSPGDLLLFYLSKSSAKSEELVRSQTVTTIGVIEQVQQAVSTTQLLRLVGRRSVYTRKDLEDWGASEDRPVLVIDFLLNGHFQPPVTLATLLARGAFTNRPPQSIKELTEESYRAVRSSTQVHYE